MATERARSINIPPAEQYPSNLTMRQPPRRFNNSPDPHHGAGPSPAGPIEGGPKAWSGIRIVLVRSFLQPNLLVMKFGGTSMGSAGRIRIAAQLAAEQYRQRPLVVVVSAMSKITDLLLDTLRKAEAGDEGDLEANLAQLSERHAATCRELLPEARQKRALERIGVLTQEFTRIARGMMLLGERPPRSVDEAVAVGERLSALLITEHLESEGVPAADVNGAAVIATDAVFGNASPLMEPTRERSAKVLQPLLARRVLPIVTGFNGSTLDGRPTTLGRGGSDFSASILAAALDASELWIWTDVDGIMTGDPRLIPDALVLEAVTYAEAAELAYNGAKVLHPRTLGPLAERGIPVRLAA